MLGAAIRTTGSLDQAKLRQALAKLTLKTVAGTFRVDAGGHQLGYGTYLMQWQDGKQKLVWPPKSAEAKIRLPR